MLIPVLTEPNYRSYLWAKQTLDGIQQEAARRKYRIVPLDAQQYTAIDYDALFGDERRMLIVIGTSVSWMPGALAFFTGKGIETVFISYDPSETVLPTGMVRMDYVGATNHLVHYLRSCGRTRIAMYGYNPNSSADHVKIRYFRNLCRQTGQDADASVFMNYASLRDCYHRFYPERSRFDAVICMNDIAAVSLISLLREDGIGVPSDLFVAAFGNSLMAERISPSVTVATLDHREMGRQAVIQFATLCRQPATASLSVRVRSHLIVRESTGFMADVQTEAPLLTDEEELASDINFYSDPEAEKLLRAETLLNSADETDLQYMRDLLCGISTEAMKNRLYLTGSALQYRKKKLMAAAECANAEAFLAFLGFCREKGIL